VKFTFAMGVKSFITHPSATMSMTGPGYYEISGIAFDVYESESLGQNKKSYAVSFILQDNLKTLTDKNIEKVMSNLIRVFEKEINAHIR
jgi:hypothetical protein